MPTALELPTSPPPATLTQRLGAFAEDIKISHTIFAMPWALFAMFLAARGTPKLLQVCLIVLCMVTARTFAMAMNRLLDARLDAANPRTARRAIPSGRLPVGFVLSAAGACAGAFIVATAFFGWVYGNWIPLACAAPVLAFVGSYPLLKRFTQWCHYYLGVALALAPLCAWIAITGRVELSPLLMAGAVLFWTAGFDIIYACQDHDSDVQNGVFSIPSRLGVANALWVARGSHFICAAFLLCLFFVNDLLGIKYGIAIGSTLMLLFVQHKAVSARDLSRVNLAFFTLNGLISLLIGILGIADVYL